MFEVARGEFLACERPFAQLAFWKTDRRIESGTAGNQPIIYFGPHELCGFTGDAYVAETGKKNANANGRSVDSRNDWTVEIRELGSIWLMPRQPID